MTGDDRIMREAADWHVASDNDTMDWDGFTNWLEADPRHRVAYDQTALSDALLSEYGALCLPFIDEAVANDAGDVADRPRRQGSWWKWGSAALAATMALAIALPFATRSDDLVYQTAATGQQVTLPDGSTVALAPNSRLVLKGGEMTDIAFAGGGLFDIRHDPSRPMHIAAGAVEISDIGTRFDVQVGDTGVRVAVAEGQINVRSATLPSVVHLNAGQSLSYDRAAGRARVATVATDTVGSWRTGHLSYESTPLSLVAQDLSRYANINVVVSAPVGQRLFSGTLALDHGDAAVQDLSQLMDLQLDRDDGTYRLSAGSR